MSEPFPPKESDYESSDLREEVEQLRRENAELRRRLSFYVSNPSQTRSPKTESVSIGIRPIASLTADSTSAEKIALFRDLFRGRDDVFAVYWVNERNGKKGYSPAVEDPWNSGKGKPKKYLSVTDRVIHDHLVGERVLGCYPLLKDNTCWFLACDFDKDGWVLDSLAYLESCNRFGVPAYLERSRSGRGGHVWIFFARPLPAVMARQLGMRLLRETMNVRADIDLASYDRFFPNQDFVPSGGFGNLIALPLQKKSRADGNTEFINPDDPELSPYTDQWELLSRIDRITATQLEALLEKVPMLMVGAGIEKQVSPFVRSRYPAPKQLQCIIGARISVEKSGMPPWLLAELKHLASFHNPKFYERQKLRLSTFQTPRLIRCYEEDIYHIHLPRGLREDVQQVAQCAETELVVTDRRRTHERLSLQFHGLLPRYRKKLLTGYLHMKWESWSRHLVRVRQ